MVQKKDVKTLRSLGGVNGVAEAVKVNIDEGVKSTDLTMRHETYGANKYTEKPSKSFFMFVWEALHNLSIIILIVCAVVSIGLELDTDGFPNGLYGGLGILLGVLLMVTVTAVGDYNQSLLLKDLDKEKKKIVCQVTRDACRKKVSIYDLVVGDIVHLSTGDQVPADGIFISGYSLLIDESSLTGESEAVHIDEKKPFVLSGTKVQDGSAKMLVAAVGMRTEWGKLRETSSDEGETETPLQVKLKGIAGIIGKIGLVFAVLSFIVSTVRLLVEKAAQDEFSSWRRADSLRMLDSLVNAITIIVSAEPEGLALAVASSIAFAWRKLMDEKAFVRHLSAIETMAHSTCICTGKTGTLTTDYMVVDKLWVLDQIIDVKEPSQLLENVPPVLLHCIFKCTDAEVGKDTRNQTFVLGTPTESAILKFGLRLGGDLGTMHSEIELLKMEPFNSEKKSMSVITCLPNGQIRAFCKGASEIVLGMCDKIIDGSGEPVQLSEEKAKVITNVINEFADKALRTLCLAYMDVEGEFDMHEDIPSLGFTLIAVVGIENPLSPGLKEAVETCLAAGISVRMVTGDNINTAIAIAKECGILTEHGIATEGPEFRNKTNEEKSEAAPIIQVVARSSPTDKLELVNNFMALSEVVAVTGNTTNDAPTLHASDIGFAMGIAGTEVAKEQADVIVMDDDFTTIVKVAKWGRAVYINIQKFFQFQLTAKIVPLIINLISSCFTDSTPFNAVQLIWVNLIVDTLGALALAKEPPNDCLMIRPPVKRAEWFITKTMWRNIIGQSVYQMVVLSVLIYVGIPVENSQGGNATDILNTFVFNTFVFCQVFNEINSRDIDKINIFGGKFSSGVFDAVLISILLQIIIVEFFGTFASTVPLDWDLWLLSIGIGFVSMPIAAVLKCIPVENSHKPIAVVLKCDHVENSVVEQHDGVVKVDVPDGVELI
ncbi:putative P-type Ca(2+) transporter [Helianthus anomalus]